MESEDDDVPLAVPLSTEAEDQVASDTASAREQRSTPAKAVPVLLITGFLGAGKTTLLNYILTAKHGYRCAVILNEFGESAGIEKAMLNDSKGSEAFELQDWVQLSNGCACCSVKNDFLRALESLMAKNYNHDYILIETTGLASPGPIAGALWTDAELESAVCLDAIVTIVDATNILRQLASHREEGEINEAQEQVAFADIILCNKVDRIGNEEMLDEVERAVRAINGEAVVHRTERCQIDLGLILHQGTYNLDRGSGFKNVSWEASKDPGSEGRTVYDHRHDQQIRTIRMAAPGLVASDRLRCWLDEILWEKENQRDILRLKGLVKIADCEQWQVVQAVQEVYDIYAVHPREGEHPVLNEVVIIGRNLDENELTTSFKQCFV